MEPKEIVRAFYESDLANNKEALNQYLHPECVLHWNSSKGFNALDRNQIETVFQDIYRSYESVNMKISHMLQDRNFVTTRYTLMVRTIEAPDDEVAMAHFITIWEVKDGKLYRGHEISQLADDSEACVNSFSKELA